MPVLESRGQPPQTGPHFDSRSRRIMIMRRGISLGRTGRRIRISRHRRPLPAALSGNRYFRYEVFMSTQDPDTPAVGRASPSISRRTASRRRRRFLPASAGELYGRCRGAELPENSTTVSVGGGYNRRIIFNSFMNVRNEKRAIVPPRAARIFAAGSAYRRCHRGLDRHCRQQFRALTSMTSTVYQHNSVQSRISRKRSRSLRTRSDQLSHPLPEHMLSTLAATSSFGFYTSVHNNGVIGSCSLFLIVIHRSIVASSRRPGRRQPIRHQAR